MRYLDHENEIREFEAKGLLAVCLQHEMDHLEGMLFVDHISALRRNMILRKLDQAQEAEDRRVGVRRLPWRERRGGGPCASSSWARRSSPCRPWRR